MATRGTEFIGTALLDAVRSNYDRRIDELMEELDKLQSVTTLERYTAWRARAEEAVEDLWGAVNAGLATDSELTGFRIKSPPAPDDFKYVMQTKESEIERLQRAKDKALAYVGALAATDGVVTLSAADLRRIGYQP